MAAYRAVTGTRRPERSKIEVVAQDVTFWAVLEVKVWIWWIPSGSAPSGGSSKPALVKNRTMSLSRISATSQLILTTYPSKKQSHHFANSNPED